MMRTASAYRRLAALLGSALLLSATLGTSLAGGSSAVPLSGGTVDHDQALIEADLLGWDTGEWPAVTGGAEDDEDADEDAGVEAADNDEDADDADEDADVEAADDDEDADEDADDADEDADVEAADDDEDAEEDDADDADEDDADEDDADEDEHEDDD